MSELGFWALATANPDRVAVIEPDGTPVTAGDLHAGANRLVHGLRAFGLKRGDTIATVLPNSRAMLELYLAAMQSGLYLTPVNWHLAGPEIAYIVKDCDAKAVFSSKRVRGLDAIELDRSRCFTVDGDKAGFTPQASLTESQPDTVPEDRTAGAVMTYTSGTTGNPRGVRRPLVEASPEVIATQYAQFLMLFGIMPGSAGVHLVVSPLYHTAVLNFSTNFLHLGHKLVVMDKWTPEGTLERIAEHRVNSSHMVPTQFRRLLTLDEGERAKYDVSSLSQMIHSAAPCPVDVKRRMLEWWGPVIYEYYAASEGGGTLATPQDWLEHPGTVGKAWPISEIRVVDDAGQPCEAGTAGTVYMRMGDHRFEYHKDRGKTDDAWKDGMFTVGDVGYLDEDGFLFLCDRKVDMIISGGVNIYPAEIESVLVSHPDVLDAAVFGIPDDDWGEKVQAVLQLVDGLEASDRVKAGVLAYATERLAKYKIPRAFDYVDALPRDDSGKLYKRKLRDPYWQGRERAI